MDKSIKYDYQSELKHFFGFDSFKGNQAAIVESIVKQQDTFVIMPTGGGKSMCYQLPALMLEGTAIVISPLIALMKDQVDTVRSHQEEDTAHFINSTLSKKALAGIKEAVKSGATKLLFLAPETLVKDDTIDFLHEVNISFVAVDEAHCISEWGHDFRPEYRNIKKTLNGIRKGIPLIALTASATPKVQQDIQKNLGFTDANCFYQSFDRTNLYYEIRPKGEKEVVFKDIVKVISQYPNKSGIVYAHNRKTVEELAECLSLNGIKAAPYHAGLDTKKRAQTQDDFLMEEVDVICATIAFGMGIDKPDVRFVIHHDISKSLENYYQETGRAGRDGLEGDCIAFYRPRDIQKLERFLSDKPLLEREVGMQMLQEVVNLAETGACRRKYILNYFGEPDLTTSCDDKMCDNCRSERATQDATEPLKQALAIVAKHPLKLKVKDVAAFLLGNSNKVIADYKLSSDVDFGSGKEVDLLTWTSILNNAIVARYLQKDVSKFGALTLTEEGQAFVKGKGSFSVPMNINYAALPKDAPKATAALDNTLYEILVDLRKAEAAKKKVPPYVVFSTATLNEMATLYPTDLEELERLGGVSKRKASKFGKPFVSFINSYVKENSIIKDTDIVVRSKANKSKIKLNIIQSVDRKIPLYEIADTNSVDMDTLLDEMNAIVSSGTQLNINYYLDEELDEDIIAEIKDYFLEAEQDDINIAFEQLKEEDITMEEIKLTRIKFMSEYAI